MANNNKRELSYLPITTRPQEKNLTWRSPTTVASVTKKLRAAFSILVSLCLLTGIIHHSTDFGSSSRFISVSEDHSNVKPGIKMFNSLLHRRFQLPHVLKSSAAAATAPGLAPRQQPDPWNMNSYSSYHAQAPPSGRVLSTDMIDGNGVSIASSRGPAQPDAQRPTEEQSRARWDTVSYQQVMHEVPSGPDPIHNR